MTSKTISLKSGVKIPALGLGTWQSTGNEIKEAVKYALEIGYRHLDTADAYENHADVARGIKESGVERKDIFITTKIWRDYLDPNAVTVSTERFLKELKTDYLDLLLIHWPNRSVPVADTLTAMQELKNRGLIRALGVSNFTERHLKDALACGVAFDMNQVEIHPTLPQTKLRAFCHEHGIEVTAYSPLAQGEDLKLPIIKELAKKYEQTPAQIILNWLLLKDLVVIPKSVTQKRITENLGALDFEIEKNDIISIDLIKPQNNRLIDPDFAEFND